MVTRFVIALAVLTQVGLAAEHQHGGQAGAQSLDVFAQADRIHVLTGEIHPGRDNAILLHRSSRDGGATWSSPVRVDEALPPAYSPRRGMDAQVTAAGENVLAAWTTAGTDQWGSGPIATAFSADGGKTWSGGVNPADDGSTKGHGFLDLVADDSGTFHITWLDSRDGKQGLRYARSSDQGRSWTPNVTLKATTCECCPNNFAVGFDRQIAVMFRDGKPRDMSVMLSRNAGRSWGEPARAGAFDWQFHGCPHVGGGLAFSREKAGVIHAVVWTGQAERAGVHVLLSADSGVSWAKPRRLGSDSATHPDLATGNGGQIAVAWDEHDEGKSVIVMSRSRDAGSSWEVPAKVSDATTSSTHPRVVATPKGFRVFWTQTSPNAPTELRDAFVP